MVYSTY